MRLPECFAQFGNLLNSKSPRDLALNDCETCGSNDDMVWHDGFCLFRCWLGVDALDGARCGGWFVVFFDGSSIGRGFSTLRDFDDGNNRDRLGLVTDRLESGGVKSTLCYRYSLLFALAKSSIAFLDC